MTSSISNLWLDREQALALADRWGTPLYVYHEGRLRQQAQTVKAFPHAFGLIPRFAMKALPTRRILSIFHDEGLRIDASSVHEVERAVRAGFDPADISLSTQELGAGFEKWVRLGLEVNCCSLHQLDLYGQAFPDTAVGLRFNPGLGSGGTGKTNVGGPSSSFGIWHAKIAEVQALLKKHRLRAFRIHSHIGSGSDPEVWKKVAGMTLEITAQFPEVTQVNLGGGYKVGRVEGEKTTDLQAIGTPVKAAFENFAKETGRQLTLEVEPGTFLVANAGILLSTVQDMTDTGEEGHRFLKLDTGMTEILRPSLYAAQHPIAIVPREDAGGQAEYVIVGHCCESGDLLTPDPGDAEKLSRRLLPRTRIGDLCLIGGAGAYCSSMATNGYNSFPPAAEVLLREDGGDELIRRRPDLESMLVHEV